MSSAEIYKQIENYENVKSIISGLYGSFNGCIDVAIGALKLDSDELIINGRSIIEKENTMSSICSELQSDVALLDAIISVCDKEIDQLWVAYYAALEREKKDKI